MFSIYHFFKSLVVSKELFLTTKKLEDFPFDETLLSCKSIGKFPDLAIRLNSNSQVLTGGELIELKDSQSYAVSSFNSTIPTGTKKIADIASGAHSSIRKQMQQAGDDLDALPIRDVYYLIRGRKKSSLKICLVHGSFFETIAIEQLIASSFEQVLTERLYKTGESFSLDMKKRLIALFSDRESFSKVRDVEQASVKLRFRIMTEVKAQGNILSPKQYPEIGDNTLNLVVPCPESSEEQIIEIKLKTAFTENEFNNFSRFQLKHHLNGNFYIFQTNF